MNDATDAVSGLIACGLKKTPPPFQDSVPFGSGRTRVNDATDAVSELIACLIAFKTDTILTERLLSTASTARSDSSGPPFGLPVGLVSMKLVSVKLPTTCAVA